VPVPPKPAPRETAAAEDGEPAAQPQPAAGGSGAAADPEVEPTPRAAPAGGGSVAADADGAADSGDSATGMWAVQLGSFSNQENAERLAADLRKQNYAAFLSRLATSSGELHRVRIGPLEDREAAEAMAERLAAAGHSGQVVPHP
jgi:DedD protein